MAEKLSEAAWTAFAKKRDLEDVSLVKALARFDKTDAFRHDARLEALDELVAQIRKQNVAMAKRSKMLGDKPFREAKDKLNELLDEAEKQQKAVRAELERSAEDDEESPALLTTRMTPLLRELRKGAVRMNALIALVGKETSVLIARRAIPQARRKLVAEAAGPGAARYVVAECFFENGELTFIVQSAAAGLAKRLKAALLAQTELRLKVRVRGDDGEDSEGEDADESEDPAQPREALVADASAASETPPAARLAEAAMPPAERLWMERLQGAQLRLDQAVRTGHPQVANLKKLIEFASHKAQVQRDHYAAMQALDKLEQMLAKPVAAASRVPDASGAGSPSGSGSGSGVAPAIVYSQARLVWAATRARIQAELKTLESAVLEHYAGQAALPEIKRSVRKLDGVMELFDDSLSDALDQALKAEDGGGKQQLHDEVCAILDRYQRYLTTEPIVTALDSNPFVPIKVQATLSASLSTLKAKIH